MLFTKNSVARKLGPDLILWVDPRKIKYDVGTKWPNTKQRQNQINQWGAMIPLGKRPANFVVNNILRRFDSFLIAPENYRPKRIIEDLSNYPKVKNAVDNRYRIDQSLWYKQLNDDLNSQGYARHKGIKIKNKQELDSFFKNYVLDLIESMETGGYDLDKGAEYGTALIDEHGSLHKAGSGYHRFFVARLVGLKSFPVKIDGVHQVWFEKQVEDKKDFKKLGNSLKMVEANYR